MATQASIERSYISARKVGNFVNFNAADYRELSDLGINISDAIIGKMVEGIGMDALSPLVTTANVGSPVQFLQTWLPGFVNIITAARNIDDIVGITTVGKWEGEFIVQGGMELTGTAVPYADYGNVPLSSWNVNYLERSIVRFEEGMQVGILEEKRASAQQINSAASKRSAAAQSLEIQRNNVGFFGYNAGINFTYGFLNDPNLGAYTIFANGASASPLWSSKSYLEIVKDIRTMIVALRSQSQNNIDPKKVKMTLALASNAVDYLSVSTDFGYSVQKWLDDTYPNIRVVSAPELNSAHSGQNVAYLFAESISDNSTDDGRVFSQNIPTKFITLGVMQKTKSYEEDYSNATAGVLTKRPWAVVRFYGE